MVSKTKRWLAVFLFVCISATLAGSVFARKPVMVGFVTKSATHQGWMIINSGAEQAAKDLKVKLLLVGPAKSDDIKGQIRVTKSLINRKVAAIAIAPCDSQKIVPMVNLATKKNIPIVAVDTAIYSDKVASFVATDNLKAASLGAKWLGKKLKGQGNVVMINGMTSQSTGKERRDGFYNYLKKHHPKMKVVQEVTANWDTELAFKGIKDALKAHKKIDAVFCAWDGGTMAVLQALKAAKRDPLLIGFDCAPNALKAMKAGDVDADVAQFLFKMGYEGVVAAVKLAKGQKIPKRIDTGSMVVTPGNVDKFVKDNKLPAL